MSKRKPHNHYAGYVFERKILHNLHGGGHLVVIDRNKGGDWIDADKRWVVIVEANDDRNLEGNFFECDSLAEARLEVGRMVKSATDDGWSLVAVEYRTSRRDYF